MNFSQVSICTEVYFHWFCLEDQLFQEFFKYQVNSQYIPLFPINIHLSTQLPRTLEKRFKTLKNLPIKYPLLTHCSIMSMQNGA